MKFILEALPQLLQGVQFTLLLTILSAFLGFLGGALMGLVPLSPWQWLRWLARVYVDFFRGTPLLAQLFMVYFGLPALVKGWGLVWSLDKLTAAVLTLSLNSAAYVAEIVRGAVLSIDRGQWEASQCLGLSPFQTLWHIIFPQAFRRMVPPLGNEFTTLLKDTSLTAMIGYQELLREGQLIVARNYRSFEIYFAVALVYWCLNSLASQGFSYLEHRLDPSKKLSRF